MFAIQFLFLDWQLYSQQRTSPLFQSWKGALEELRGEQVMLLEYLE